MAISIDWATKIITIPQSDLSFVSGTLYDCDTDAIRAQLNALQASEEGMAFPRNHIHNTEVTVAGVTYARFIEIINGYSLKFEDTGSAYSIRLIGSNNNFFDQENGILVPTPLTTVIPGNSAGLVVTAVSGLTAAESAALLQIETDVALLLTGQDLTNEQKEAEHITSRTLGKVILRNTTVMRRWEADAWEDESKSIPYGTNPNTGIEAVGMLVEVAWS